MATVELREPSETDWPAILDLANRSVRDVAGAGSQEDWLENRLRGAPIRRHFVAVEQSRIVGYAGLESQFDQVEGGFRLFVVTESERLADIGVLLHRRLHDLLRELSAVEAWLIEYAADERLLRFLSGLGFSEVRRFRLEPDVECAVVSRRLTDA